MGYRLSKGSSGSRGSSGCVGSSGVSRVLSDEGAWVYWGSKSSKRPWKVLAFERDFWILGFQSNLSDGGCWSHILCILVMNEPLGVEPRLWLLIWSTYVNTEQPYICEQLQLEAKIASCFCSSSSNFEIYFWKCSFQSSLLPFCLILPRNPVLRTHVET